MDKENAQVEETQEQHNSSQPGETWQNPGEFPEFKGGQKQDETETTKTTETKKEEPDYEKMADEYRARVEALRSAEIPEGKFKYPDEVLDAVLEEIDTAMRKEDSGWRRHFLESAESDLERLERHSGKLDAEIGDKLWSLYSDPEISVGIHGTMALRDSDMTTENSTFFKDGIGCGWRNMCRTVAFQDRKVHAHGFISFPKLLGYGYPFDETSRAVVRMKKMSEFGYEEYTNVSGPSVHCAVIAAIPKSLAADDERLVSGQGDFEIMSGYKGRSVKAFRLKPEFVVGIIPDRQPNNIVWNPAFDAEHVRELSRQGAAEEEEKERKYAEERAEYDRQRAEQAEREAKSLKGRLKRLFSRDKK